jgi:hypothetical protein
LRELYVSPDTAGNCTTWGQSPRTTATPPTRWLLIASCASLGRTPTSGIAAWSLPISITQFRLFSARWIPMMRSAPEMPYQDFARSLHTMQA